MDNLPDSASNSQAMSLTRRQFSRRVLGATTGMLLASAAEGQDKPAPPPADDPRLAELEKERGVPLTPAQRKGLPGQLKDLDESVAAGRKFHLDDGGSEPCFVFQPTNLTPGPFPKRKG